jgi:hypothetical protein
MSEDVKAWRELLATKLERLANGDVALSRPDLRRALNSAARVARHGTADQADDVNRTFAAAATTVREMAPGVAAVFREAAELLSEVTKEVN